MTAYTCLDIRMPSLFDSTLGLERFGSRFRQLHLDDGFQDG